MSATPTDAIPTPTTANYIAKGIYICLNVLACMAGAAAMKLADSAITVYGAWALLTGPIFLAYLEIDITYVMDHIQTTSRVRREMLFIGEIIQPLMIIAVLPALPEMLHLFGYNIFSNNSLALIDASLMLVIAFGGIFANRRWALSRLHLPR